LGNTQAAIEALAEGIRIGQALPESNVLGWLYSDLADTYRGQGDLDRAESLYRQDIELAHRLGEQWVLAHHYVNLADIAIQRGMIDHAEALLKESVPILIQFGDQYGLSYSLLGLAKFAWLRGDVQETRALCTKILGLQRHLGRMRYIPSMIEELADFMAIHGGANSAAGLLGSTDSYRRREDYPPEPVEEQIRDHASSLALSSLGEAAFQSASLKVPDCQSSRRLSGYFLPRYN
jgi:tetratricopeptide (TPR) repeat protein